ncbi:hypothetical protein CASFOL_014208 [Castilleja foliolosa]|uniref:RING-type domain-containing protein n=1 Tax=Castilleja foliolosa TaxID=1961234 RepID=A0ABD3DM77_9LAMI
MALKSGYEYSYNISKDEKIIPKYTAQLVSPSYNPTSDLGVNRKVFIFEFRTKFTVRPRNLNDNCETMSDSESLAVTLLVSTDGDFVKRFYPHFRHINYRLTEYSMPNDQIQTLIHQTLDFAYQTVIVDPSSPIVSIGVDVEACTVQLDGETVHDATNRSVRPDCLIPLELVLPVKKLDKSRRRLRNFVLFGLPRSVVDKGFDMMETCSICMGGPTAGGTVSWLPCKHAFHRHCVVRWLMEKVSCPLCRHEVVLEKGGRPKDLGCYVVSDDTEPGPLVMGLAILSQV